MKKYNLKKNKNNNISDRVIRILSIIIILTVVSLYLLSGLYSKYHSRVDGKSNIRAAKLGELQLIEDAVINTDDDISINNELVIEDFDVYSGEEVNKSVSLTYSTGELDSYIYFVVYTNNWNYDEENRTFYIKNNINDSYLMHFTINDEWNYIKKDTMKSKEGEINCFVFYVKVLENINFESNIMDTIHVDLISYDNLDVISGTKLRFGAYVISEKFLLTPGLAWDSLKNKIEK